MTGVLVEGVHAVIDLPPDAIEAPPQFGTGAAGHYLLGMGALGEHFVPILDIDRVLTEDGVLAQLGVVLDKRWRQHEFQTTGAEAIDVPMLAASVPCSVEKGLGDHGRH